MKAFIMSSHSLGYDSIATNPTTLVLFSLSLQQHHSSLWSELGVAWLWVVVGRGLE